jgi:hypothetical protein
MFSDRMERDAIKNAVEKAKATEETIVVEYFACDHEDNESHYPVLNSERTEMIILFPRDSFKYDEEGECLTIRKEGMDFDFDLYFDLVENIRPPSSVELDEYEKNEEGAESLETPLENEAPDKFRETIFTSEQQSPPNNRKW